jgi:Molecular chaperone GrpE (heat shock protein)
MVEKNIKNNQAVEKEEKSNINKQKLKENQSDKVNEIEDEKDSNLTNNNKLLKESENRDESEILNQDLLKQEIEELRDERLRLLAEMENLRKRSNKEKSDSIKYGSFNLAKDILLPDDNLTRALDAIPKDETTSETIKNLIEGLKMVQKEFASILEKHGVKKIKALNEKFDHNFHQAMTEIEREDIEEGIVIEEMQSGYTMHDRLLRPSMVGVSKKPEKEEKS